MANSHRGEIEVTLEGKTYPLCLTLGALAELETAFGSEDLIAVIERFQNGKIKTGAHFHSFYPYFSRHIVQIIVLNTIFCGLSQKISTVGFMK